jgi:ubiquinone/menaquinone biosynthesis C-methylase UbiE
MSKSHETLVDAQFSPQAQAYVDSPVHSRGEDLDRIEQLAQRATPMNALDLGTGGGHVAYRLARHARKVIAVDLSQDMLAAVKATAISRGLTNIETERSAAEDLPFPDATFDFCACRLSAHHWRDLEAGLQQAHRVLRKDSPAIFVDVYSPGVALLDTHLQSVEILRDTSHVRDYAMSEWLAVLARNGFGIQATRAWRIPTQFDSWIARMRTPPELAQAIRALQTSASDTVREYFRIQSDGSFELDAFMVETLAC